MGVDGTVLSSEDHSEKMIGKVTFKAVEGKAKELSNALSGLVKAFLEASEEDDDFKRFTFTAIENDVTVTVDMENDEPEEDMDEPEEDMDEGDEADMGDIAPP